MPAMLPGRDPGPFAPPSLSILLIHLPCCTIPCAGRAATETAGNARPAHLSCRTTRRISDADSPSFPWCRLGRNRRMLCRLGLVAAGQIRLVAVAGRACAGALCFPAGAGGQSGRRPHLCRLWRDLCGEFDPVALACGGGAARPVGYCRGDGERGRQRTDRGRSAGRLRTHRARCFRTVSAGPIEAAASGVHPPAPR